jgi:L-2-hydroxyglutarate oxidase LhgO
MSTIGNSKNCHILICGAGIVGLTLARELASRGVEGITLLEGEPELGRHASGRNSGVLHAGIYYAQDSLRAKTCLAGNRLMKTYCEEKGLPLFKTGKVIVAKNENDLPAMETLYQRAITNGTTIRWIDEKELAELEPLAKTTGGQALYSPETAVVEPKTILASLSKDLSENRQVRLLEQTVFQGLCGPKVAATSQGVINFNFFINTAGLNSDRVAHAFGLGQEYTLVPFKGIYHQFISSRAGEIRGNIYPVPDIRNPFLGVHFTRGASGRVYLGPTSIPAFGRKNYGLIKGAKLTELPPILKAIAIMFFKNPGFRSLALSEPRKYLPYFFYLDAKELLKKLHPSEIRRCDKVGIRHQLIDRRNWSMIMDFFSVQDERSFHVLNAISPGFTSSMSLTPVLADQILASFSL